MTTKILNRRQVRWVEQLASFNFKIVYRKGSENGKVDALSRRCDYTLNRPELSPALLERNNEGTPHWDALRFHPSNHGQTLEMGVLYPLQRSLGSP